MRAYDDIGGDEAFAKWVGERGGFESLAWWTGGGL